MLDPIINATAVPEQRPTLSGGDDRMIAAAKALEASFLAEMLKSAGLDAAPDGMGSGTGQDQFTTFLLEAQAERIVAAGGIGLAESIYHAMQGDDR